MNKINIHHVCSLGTLCQSSQLCKNTGLKQESYPFDWIFSTIPTVIKIIEDNFNQFLNKEMYTSKGSTKCDHTLYGPIFNHHNPKNKDHYNYFTRCVERFRTLLCRNENKLFVIFFPNISDVEISTIKQQVIHLQEYLSRKTSNHYIIAICHIPGQESFKTTIVDIKNIKLVTLYTKSKSNGVTINDPNENIMLEKLLLDSYSFQIQKLHA